MPIKLMWPGEAPREAGVGADPDVNPPVNFGPGFALVFPGARLPRIHARFPVLAGEMSLATTKGANVREKPSSCQAKRPRRR
jgi:hypothetical protein